MTDYIEPALGLPLALALWATYAIIRHRDTRKPAMPPKLATPEEFAAFLNVDVEKIDYYRKNKIGPAPFKLDRVTFRYHWKDIYAWVSTRRAQESTSG